MSTGNVPHESLSTIAQEVHERGAADVTPLRAALDVAAHHPSIAKRLDVAAAAFGLAATLATDAALFSREEQNEHRDVATDTIKRIGRAALALLAGDA